MASFGSGGQLIGANANQLLGQSPTINQVSASSPSFNPQLMPPSPMAVPQMAPQGQPAPQMPSLPGGPQVPNQMPQAPQMPMGQSATPSVMGTPPSNPEAMAIVNALKSRLGSISTSEEMKNGGLP